jgi:uncharacterized protein (DUF1786 family)
LKILTADIGTGTQDILLFDSRLNIENGYKLILPSPTMMIRGKIRHAAAEKRDVLLSGVTMGGGPCGWAASDHIKAGLKVYATEDAAKTFDDDLEKIRSMGIILVSEDEALRLSPKVARIEMKDFDFDLITRTYAMYGVDLSDLDAVAVAVFDHGNAPPEISDRQFRFEYLDQRIREENRLSAFAFRSEHIPPIMTRMLAVAKSAGALDIPLVVMDTAPAAILGASFDPVAATHTRRLIVNMGNLHMLAFRLGPSGIEGVLEHHSPMLKQPRLEALLMEFAAGTLTNRRVFEDHGHGALLYTPEPYPMDDPHFNIVVTGPRRSLLRDSTLKPLFAVPFGDMMLAGCFGLLAATAEILPELAGPILKALKNDSQASTEPWCLD